MLSQTLRNLSCVCLTEGALIHGFPWIIISGNFLKVSKKSIQLSDHCLNVVTALIHARRIKPCKWLGQIVFTKHTNGVSVLIVETGPLILSHSPIQINICIYLKIYYTEVTKTGPLLCSWNL